MDNKEPWNLRIGLIPGVAALKITLSAEKRIKELFCGDCRGKFGDAMCAFVAKRIANRKNSWIIVAVLTQQAKKDFQEYVAEYGKRNKSLAAAVETIPVFIPLQLTLRASSAIMGALIAAVEKNFNEKLIAFSHEKIPDMPATWLMTAALASGHKEKFLGFAEKFCDNKYFKLLFEKGEEV